MGRKKKICADPKAVVVYMRVSTGDQTLGLEAQKAANERYALAHGLTIVESFTDFDVSGGLELEERLEARHALFSALTVLEQGRASGLLVAKRDRLARDVVVASALERLVAERNGRVISADGTGNAPGPEGMLLRGIVDLFAQYERAVIRARTASALSIKKARGERVGRVPIGFRAVTSAGDVSVLEQDALEQAALVRMMALRAEGFSVRAIAEVLTEEGTPARGRRWYPTTVGRLLALALARVTAPGV